MKRKLYSSLAALMLLILLSGCGSMETAEQTQASAEQNNAVASAEEMSSVQDVVTDDMTAIAANQLKDGVYSIQVDSSSPMFNITDCELTVKNGEMTAVMTMHGKGYLYVYPGTGAEAVQAQKEDYIPFVEDQSGAHTFSIPVNALDCGIPCTAFSKNKEKWYDRTLVFRADSLPMDAFTDDRMTSLESLQLKDGKYLISAALEGGSGRASIQSPAELHIQDGKATVVIIWSSPNFDYMKVDDVQYDRINTDGNSMFEIPVNGFDYKMPVSADTTAMSTPHEIDYTLYFDSTTIDEIK